jgi:hypothetical protein
MTYALFPILALLFLVLVLKKRSIDLEISGHVFKRRLPTRMTDTWKKDLRKNAIKINNTLGENPEMMAYFIVENIQDYRKSFY